MSLIVAAVICRLSGCASAQPAAAAPLLSGKNVLIVHLSRTNNTKAIADIIHQEVGGRIVALELESPYPADYRATVQQVARENEIGYLPPLRTKIDDIDHDVVFVGFPTWGMQLPPPVKSFLARQRQDRGSRA